MLGQVAGADRLTLYGSFTSSSSYKPMLYLALARLPFSFRTVNLKTGVQNSPDYLAINRWGVVPSLRHRGLTILQSNVILDYLARETGHFEGATEQQRWQAREWLSWEADHITAVARVRHAARFRPVHPEVIAEYRPRAEAALSFIDKALRDRDVAGRRALHDRRYRLLGPHGVHGRGRVRHRELAPSRSLVAAAQGDARLRAALRSDPEQGPRVRPAIGLSYRAVQHGGASMPVPERMRFIDMTGTGGPEVLTLAEGKVPQPGEGEVLIRVAAAGVNRPDVLQRQRQLSAAAGRLAGARIGGFRHDRGIGRRGRALEGR